MSAILEQLDNVIEQYETYLQAVELGYEGKEKPRFEVTDKSSAEWVLRKIAKLHAEQTENTKIANDQIEPLAEEVQKIRAWEQAENNKIQNNVNFLSSLLEPYHRMILEADPKAKTIKLPHGELKIRKQQPEIIKNDDLLLVWLESSKLEQYIKVEKKPQWGELKKNVEFPEGGGAVYKETGEVILGVTTQDRPDKFEVVIR